MGASDFLQCPGTIPADRATGDKGGEMIGNG